MNGDFRGLIGQKLADDRTIITAWGESGTLHLVVRRDIEFYKSSLEMTSLAEGYTLDLKQPEPTGVLHPYREEVG